MKPGMWWCPKCKVEVPPLDVTFHEMHDEQKGFCGCAVYNSPALEPKVGVGGRYSASDYDALMTKNNHLEKQLEWTQSKVEEVILIGGGYAKKAAAAEYKVQRMALLLKRIGYPGRRSADEHMDIQGAADMIQAEFTCEELQ